MGVELGIDYVTWSNTQKWISPTSNPQLRPKKNFQPYMGIGLGVDYVAWSNLQKRIPPFKFSCGKKENFKCYGYMVGYCLCHVGQKMKFSIPWV